MIVGPNNDRAIADSTETACHADGRMDFGEIQGNPFLERIAPAVALHVRSDTLIPKGDGTFRFKVTPWVDSDFDTPCPSGNMALCENVRFFGQPVPEPRKGNTAFLVGEDLVMLARHTFGGSGGNPAALCESGRAFIFDYFNANPVTVPGEPGLYLIIPEKNVYFCSEFVARGDGVTAEHDWAIVRLDRPVPQNRIPFRIRRSGEPAVDDPIAIAGFPDRLPLKFEPTSISSTSSTLLRSFAFVRDGSSGSPQVNEDTGRVEGIIRSGATFLGCDSPNDCLSQPECTRQAVATAAINAAGALPPIGLQIVESGPTDHYGPPGGPFTNSEPREVLGHTYRYLVPRPTPGFLPSRTADFTISPDVSGLIGIRRPGRSTALVEPISGSLSPGEDGKIAAALMPIVYELPMGSHPADIDFIDHTYRVCDTRKHRIFVGVEGFELTPDEPFNGDGPGALPSEEMVYSLTNRHFVEQRVIITPSDPWILVNGHAGPVEILLKPADYDTGLAPTHDVRIGFNEAGLSVGVHAGSLEFRSVFDGIPAPTAQQRDVRLDIGRVFFEAPDLPITINGDDSTEIAIPVPMTFLQIQDIDLTVEIEYLGGTHRVSGQLIAPSSESIFLHESLNASVPGQVIFRTFDDETDPPRGPLSTFDGDPPGGVWTVLLEPSAPTELQVKRITLRITMGHN
ncbi:MAG: serine protease [Phycisphaerales bacterium]|nr:serine protease [Phycisphaerales bacterium]